MTWLPLEVGVTQGHTDVIQEAGQRAQFDDGILCVHEKGQLVEMAEVQRFQEVPQRLIFLWRNPKYI